MIKAQNKTQAVILSHHPLRIKFLLNLSGIANFSPNLLRFDTSLSLSLRTQVRHVFNENKDDDQLTYDEM